MKPIPVPHRRIQQPREVMMLDDTEMELELLELAQTTTLSDPYRTPEKPGQSYDALCEFGSAASLIFDRDEYIALERQLARILQPHPQAA